MNELFARFRPVDEISSKIWEKRLIGADVGFDTAIKLTDSYGRGQLKMLRNRLKFKMSSLRWSTFMKRKASAPENQYN